MHLLAINLLISNLLRLGMNKFAQVVSLLMVNSSIIALFPAVTVNVLNTADISSIQCGYNLLDNLRGM